eukprot:6107419-Prymnesium_polylepis.1
MGHRAFLHPGSTALPERIHFIHIRCAACALVRCVCLWSCRSVACPPFPLRMPSLRVNFTPTAEGTFTLRVLSAVVPRTVRFP